MSAKCPSPESGSGRHVVGAENVDARSPRDATCLACRQRVKRAHAKSPWWYTYDAPAETPTVIALGVRGISICVEGEDAGDVGTLFADALGKASNALRDGLTVDTATEFRTAKATIRVESGIKR